MMHTMDSMADKFIKDVREIVIELMKDPGKPVEGKVNKLKNANPSIPILILILAFYSSVFLIRWHCMVLLKHFPIDHL